jgi:hypothetical protein
VLGSRASDQGWLPPQRSGRKTSVEKIQPVGELLLKGCSFPEVLTGDRLPGDGLVGSFNNTMFSGRRLLNEVDLNTQADQP